MGEGTPFYLSPAVGVVCVKGYSSDWVTETKTWKVGRGTDHSSKFSHAHRCFLPSPASAASSEASGCSGKGICGSWILFQRLTIITRRVMKNLLEEALSTVNLFSMHSFLFFFSLFHPLHFHYG